MPVATLTSELTSDLNDLPENSHMNYLKVSTCFSFQNIDEDTVSKLLIPSILKNSLGVDELSTRLINF